MPSPFLPGLFLALVLPAAIVRAESAITIPGLSWTIVPPPGFTMIAKPVTMLRNSAGAFMLPIQYDPGTLPPSDFPLGQVIGTAPERARFDAVEDITLTGAAGYLAQGRYIDKHYDIMLLALKSDRSILMVTVGIPDGAEAATDKAAIRLALLTLAETNAPLDPAARLNDFPVEIGTLEGLRVANVILGTTVLLTDGPVSQPQDSATQRFMVISAMEFPEGQPADFDAASLAWPMAYDYQKSHPSAEILSARAETGAAGERVVVLFREDHPTGGTVRGALLTRPFGKVTLTMIVQYPENDEAALDSARRIYDSVKSR